MMCLACEQDAMWFAYLRRKGLITPDGYLVEEPPSLFGSTEPALASVPAETRRAQKRVARTSSERRAQSVLFSASRRV